MFSPRMYKVIALINIGERAFSMIERCAAFPSLRIDDKTE